MNIFLESNYRLTLKEIVEHKRQIDRKFNFQAIAETTRIPKSYISKVINEKAHLSSDQLFLVSEYLELNENEFNFLHLLLEKDRCVIAARKKILTSQIQELRSTQLDSQKYIQANPDALDESSLEKYYMDPLNQLVHICLSIPRYQSNLQLLSQDLSITPSNLGFIVDFLEKTSIIKQTPAGYQTVIKNIHLPKSSSVHKAWRTQLKLFSLDRLNRLSTPEDYTFSVLFSSNEKVREKVKAEFLSFLSKAEHLVKDSPMEETYQMNFDLFGWT